MGLIWVRQLLVWSAAGAAIFISYRLYSRFRRKYLRDWFLFVVVFNLGLYLFDLLKTVFPGLIHLGSQHQQQLDVVFNALLIRPLIFLGLILFLRFITGLIEIRLHWVWNLAAVLFISAYLVWLGALAVRFFVSGHREWYTAMTVASDWLVIGGLYGAVAFMLGKTGTGEAGLKRQLLRNLGIIFFLCQTVLVFFPTRQPPLLAGFFLILPPLLYLWRIHGELFQEQRQLDIQGDDLAVFLSEFGLTRREQEIVALICKGRDNQAAADELFISTHTVKHHVTAIFQKLGVRNRIQLVNLISNVDRGESRDLSKHS